ncbi:TonB-dependent receptor plug domain-containing protein [Pelagerythrobacter aerophilus]|uniref:TonB-dependent receptor n=1 Tax=Pelagerythrobacter aerophilus TaxID=2306995 RepID=A0A418NM01_9SPHN|nr:TonB-dependent receptor [Pelagerythrobacter aerophilus]RIV81272.1 TonB-dependent receptor [Pelagerythrobacter aerophilus]
MRNYLIIGASLVALAAPLQAQESDDAAAEAPKISSDPFADFRPEETEITVTATGTRIEIEDTGQAVTVIGEEEIRSIQGADLTRVLERVPGLAVSRDGGVGAVTNVGLRGAEGEQLLVLIDGVRVADPASPGGGFDFGNLLTSNLAKIEVLRGSNSTIWGSDAIGGVIVASTRAESGLQVSAEYGARDTATGAVSGGIGGDRGFLGASASYYTTDGFSQAANGTEADGFEQWTASGQGRLYLSPSFEIFARGRWAEGDLDLDGYQADFSFGDTEDTQHTQQYSGSAGAIYDTGPLFVSAAYSFADTERVNRNPASEEPTFSSDGHSDRVEMRGEWRPIGPLLVNFGAENEWEAFSTSSEERRTTRIFGAYTQLGIEMGPLAAHAGVRLDDHARFGSETSFGGDISYALTRDLRLRASVGEGFKAPTLYQLFSDYGNPALQPERSTSYDIGLIHGDRSLTKSRFYGALTAFRRDARDQIEFVSCFSPERPEFCGERPNGFYDNTDRARAQGVEVELGARPSDRVTTRAVYAYVDTENRTAGSANQGNVLARRPQHALTLSADWRTPLRDFTIGGDVRMVSDSFENATNTTPLDGYALASVRASLPFGERFELFGRVENLFDTDYQTAAGYGTPGRSAYIGARAQF